MAPPKAKRTPPILFTDLAGYLDALLQSNDRWATTVSAYAACDPPLSPSREDAVAAFVVTMHSYGSTDAVAALLLDRHRAAATGRWGFGSTARDRLEALVSLWSRLHPQDVASGSEAVRELLHLCSIGQPASGVGGARPRAWTGSTAWDAIAPLVDFGLSDAAVAEVAEADLSTKDVEGALSMLGMELPKLSSEQQWDTKIKHIYYEQLRLRLAKHADGTLPLAVGARSWLAAGPSTVAQYLALRDQQLYQRVTHTCLYTFVWKVEASSAVQRPATAMVDWFNRVANTVAHALLI